MADLIKLANELANDPLSRGYAGMTAEQRLDSLRTADRVIVAPRLITPQLLIEVYGASDAAAILDALESAAAGDAAVKWALQIIYPSRGGIMSDAPGVATLLADLVAAEVITSGQLATLTAALTRTVDRLTELGIGDAHLGDVIAAAPGI